jgi:uncharacterized protein (PEP-CTERM system associated)
MTMVTDTSLPVKQYRDWQRALRIAIALLASGSVGGAYGASWRIDPEISVNETYSDNVALASVSAAEEGWITTVTPGLRVSGLGARIQAYLNYRHQESYYHGRSASNAGQDFLSSYATLEAIDNWMYVDATASVTPRSRSVFSPNTTNMSNTVGNQDETRVIQISPNIRGRLFGSTDYTMRVTSIDARSTSDTLGHTQVDQLTGSLRKSAGQGVVGWFADGNSVRVDSSVDSARSDDRVRGGVILPVIPHLYILAFSGRERTDYASSNGESLSTPGFGFEWKPSANTQAIGMREKRFFGVGHDVSFIHRTPRSAWRYSDVKDAAVLPMGRSEERRVGKECRRLCRSRWSPYH